MRDIRQSISSETLTCHAPDMLGEARLANPMAYLRDMRGPEEGAETARCDRSVLLVGPKARVPILPADYALLTSDAAFLRIVCHPFASGESSAS